MVLFYVKHGDDHVSMFNAKCQTVVLSNYIRKSLQLPSDSVIDLVPVTNDPKLLAPLGFPDKVDGTYANTFMTLRGNYAVCTIREDEDGAKEWHLQWKTRCDERDKISAALDTRNAEEKKKTAASKGKGGKK
jgi:hypothetical protein